MENLRMSMLGLEDFRPAAPRADENRKVSAAAHFGASNAKEFASWLASNGSADADLNPDLATLRTRSRDLQRNHGVASGVLQTMGDNIVATGPRLAMLPDYRALGKDIEWAQEYSLQVEGGFRSWFESKEIDVRGLMDGGMIARLVLESALASGDVIALPIWNPSPNRKWATQLQILEGDRLSNPNGKWDSESLRGGVEIDKYGRPLAYHIEKAHPGDRFRIWSSNLSQWERIPAETAWGRKRVIHVYRSDRPDQSRGKPLMAALIGEFKMLSKYQQAELQAAVINAVIAATLKTPLDGAAAGDLLGLQDGGPNSKQYAAHVASTEKILKPFNGAFLAHLPPGTELDTWTPGRPSDAFGPFVQVVLEHIAAGLNLPVELLLKKWSDSNYSSARAALLEAWRMFLTYRKWLKVTFLDVLVELWLEEAIDKRVVNIITLDDFYRNRYAYLQCKFRWPGRGWVDPVKEAQGAEIRMNIGISTLDAECAEQGQDWQEVADQRAVEKAYLESRNLTYGDMRPIAPEKQEEKQAA